MFYLFSSFRKFGQFSLKHCLTIWHFKVSFYSQIASFIWHLFDYSPVGFENALCICLFASALKLFFPLFLAGSRCSHQRCPGICSWATWVRHPHLWTFWNRGSRCAGQWNKFTPSDCYPSYCSGPILRRSGPSSLGHSRYSNTKHSSELPQMVRKGPYTSSYTGSFQFWTWGRDHRC